MVLERNRCAVGPGSGATAPSVGSVPGLRVSELAHLPVADIDSKRVLIHVRQGKGGKAHLVPLSPALLGPLRILLQLPS